MVFGRARLPLYGCVAPEALIRDVICWIPSIVMMDDVLFTVQT